MFFILSKTLDFLLMPIIWVLGLLILALFQKRPNRKRRFLRAGIILLLIFSNPLLINSALLWWEIPPLPLEQLEKKYEVGVVLTGVTLSKKSPKDRVYFKAGADRITHALMLYRKGYIRKILITGGVIDIYGNSQKSESRRLAEFLELARVPKEDIILEEKARNTRENALHAKQILDERFPGKKHLLITSGFHMRRARGCFKKAGLELDVFSAGFYTQDFSKEGFLAIIPSEEALYRSYILCHEILGYLVYWLIGYLS